MPRWYEEPWNEWMTFRDKLIWIDAYNYEMELEARNPVREWLEKLEFDPDSTFEYPVEDFDDNLSFDSEDYLDCRSEKGS